MLTGEDNGIYRNIHFYPFGFMLRREQESTFLYIHSRMFIAKSYQIQVMHDIAKTDII